MPQVRPRPVVDQLRSPVSVSPDAATFPLAVPVTFPITTPVWVPWVFPVTLPETFPTMFILYGILSHYKLVVNGMALDYIQIFQPRQCVIHII